MESNPQPHKKIGQTLAQENFHLISFHFTQTQFTHKMHISPCRAIGFTFPLFRFYYAFGNTPPCDLFASIPPTTSNCSILSIGCGDIRSVLFSLWLRGMMTWWWWEWWRNPCFIFFLIGDQQNKNPIFVLNDINPAIIARDVILLLLSTSAPTNFEKSLKGIN